MFVFYFHNRLNWYYKRIMSTDPVILWKITVSGPFVTLYSENDYIFIIKNKNYSIVQPFLVEHMPAHGENVLDSLYSSNLRDTHTHVTLPCKKSIVAELKELLEFIGEHNKPNKKLINSDSIEKCVAAYQRYLNTASLDEHKKNVNYLLMRWIGPHINREIMPWISLEDESLSLEKKSSNNMEILDHEMVGIAIMQFLDCPNQNSFEQFNNEITGLLSSSPRLEIDLINKIRELMPKSSTDLFNHFVNQNPIFSFASLLGSGALILKICNMLALDEITLLVAGGLILYGPSLAEQGFTLVSKYINSEDKNSIWAEQRKAEKMDGFGLKLPSGTAHLMFYGSSDRDSIQTNEPSLRANSVSYRK